ncbi:MAG: MBL fold metallo-hydrolase [Deltaproteobacteria bacterium]|nr:MBL fold metallo-hydrolase [Deltaproteobacteria bacterium]
MRLRGTSLYLDATQATGLAFVSHAHSDHAARHQRVLATEATLRLLAHRVGKLPSSLAIPYHQPFTLDGIEMELVPAGHVLGSAQIRMTYKERCIGYTGDLNTAAALTAEPAGIAFCEVLVIESTFGLPKYRFPPREETYQAIRSFARESLDAGATPVFFGYTLGKSQEAMKLLSDGGFPVAVHASIADMADHYIALGCPLPHRRFDGAMRPGEALIFPMHLTRSRALDKIGAAKTAVLTGWALDPGTRYRYGTDAAFPLSDHADFDGLLSYVEKTGARKVLTVHGFAKELAACLRDRGYDAQPLMTPRQLELF